MTKMHPPLKMHLPTPKLANFDQKLANNQKNEIPGLGRGALSISESESARNFMDKCVYEKFSQKKMFFFRGFWGFGFLGFWVLGFGFLVLGFGFWVLGFGFWVLGFGFWGFGVLGLE